MRKKSPSLAPPFITKRTSMQGKKVIEVKIDKNAILVNSKEEKKEPSDEEGSDGYSRTRVYDSWEY